jgi:hypothetical protein
MAGLFNGQPPSTASQNLSASGGPKSAMFHTPPSHHNETLEQLKMQSFKSAPKQKNKRVEIAVIDVETTSVKSLPPILVTPSRHDTSEILKPDVVQRLNSFQSP